MEEIITSQTKDKDMEDVDELILDAWRGSRLSPEDKERIESFSNLDFLSLTGCGLNSLQNFPYLPSLMKLELSDNHIKDGLENLARLTEIMQLSLAGNQISKLDDLKPLTRFPSLVCLELMGNPVAEMQNYSKSIFGMISSLQILDGRDLKGDEVSMDSNEEEDFGEESEEELADLLDEDESEEEIEEGSEDGSPSKKQNIESDSGEESEN